MSRKAIRHCTTALVPLLALALSACPPPEAGEDAGEQERDGSTSPDGGADASSPEDGGAQSPVTLTPSEAWAIPLGQVQFEAALGEGVEGTLVWSVEEVPGGNGEVGTITSEGLYIAPGALQGPRDVNVTAALESEPEVSGSAVVHLALAFDISVAVNPTPSAVQVGRWRQFRAVVTGVPDNRVRWKLNGLYANPVVGDDRIGYLDSTGYYDAPQDLTNPPFTSPLEVVAVSLVDGSESPPVQFQLADLYFDYGELLVADGPDGDAAIRATVDLSDGTWTDNVTTPADFSYVSDDGNKASVDNSGVVSAEAEIGSTYVEVSWNGGEASGRVAVESLPRPALVIDLDEGSHNLDVAYDLDTPASIVGLVGHLPGEQLELGIWAIPDRGPMAGARHSLSAPNNLTVQVSGELVLVDDEGAPPGSPSDYAAVFDPKTGWLRMGNKNGTGTIEITFESNPLAVVTKTVEVTLNKPVYEFAFDDLEPAAGTPLLLMHPFKIGGALTLSNPGGREIDREVQVMLYRLPEERLVHTSHRHLRDLRGVGDIVKLFEADLFHDFVTEQMDGRLQGFRVALRIPSFYDGQDDDLYVERDFEVSSLAQQSDLVEALDAWPWELSTDGLQFVQGTALPLRAKLTKVLNYNGRLLPKLQITDPASSTSLHRTREEADVADWVIVKHDLHLAQAGTYRAAVVRPELDPPEGASGTIEVLPPAVMAASLTYDDSRPHCALAAIESGQHGIVGVGQTVTITGKVYASDGSPAGLVWTDPGTGYAHRAGFLLRTLPTPLTVAPHSITQPHPLNANAFEAAADGSFSITFQASSTDTWTDLTLKLAPIEIVYDQSGARSIEYTTPNNVGGDKNRYESRLVLHSPYLEVLPRALVRPSAALSRLVQDSSDEAMALKQQLGISAQGDEPVFTLLGPQGLRERFVEVCQGGCPDGLVTIGEPAEQKFFRVLDIYTNTRSSREVRVRVAIANAANTGPGLTFDPAEVDPDDFSPHMDLPVQVALDETLFSGTDIYDPGAPPLVDILTMELVRTPTAAERAQTFNMPHHRVSNLALNAVAADPVVQRLYQDGKAGETPAAVLPVYLSVDGHVENMGGYYFLHTPDAAAQVELVPSSPGLIGLERFNGERPGFDYWVTGTVAHFKDPLVPAWHEMARPLLVFGDLTDRYTYNPRTGEQITERHDLGGNIYRPRPDNVPDRWSPALDAELIAVRDLRQPAYDAQGEPITHQVDGRAVPLGQVVDVDRFAAFVFRGVHVSELDETKRLRYFGVQQGSGAPSLAIEDMNDFQTYELLRLPTEYPTSPVEPALGWDREVAFEVDLDLLDRRDYLADGATRARAGQFNYDEEGQGRFPKDSREPTGAGLATFGLELDGVFWDASLIHDTPPNHPDLFTFSEDEDEPSWNPWDAPGDSRTADGLIADCGATSGGWLDLISDSAGLGSGCAAGAFQVVAETEGFDYPGLDASFWVSGDPTESNNGNSLSDNWEGESARGHAVLPAYTPPIEAGIMISGVNAAFVVVTEPRGAFEGSIEGAISLEETHNTGDMLVATARTDVGHAFMEDLVSAARSAVISAAAAALVAATGGLAAPAILSSAALSGGISATFGVAKASVSREHRQSRIVIQALGDVTNGIKRVSVDGIGRDDVVETAIDVGANQVINAANRTEVSAALARPAYGGVATAQALATGMLKLSVDVDVGPNESRVAACGPISNEVHVVSEGKKPLLEMPTVDESNFYRQVWDRGLPDMGVTLVPGRRVLGHDIVDFDIAVGGDAPTEFNYTRMAQAMAYGVGGQGTARASVTRDGWLAFTVLGKDVGVKPLQRSIRDFRRVPYAVILEDSTARD